MNRKGLSRLQALLVITAVAVAGMLMFTSCDDSDDVTGTDGVSSAWSINELTLEGNHFRGVSFVDEDNGWLAGLGGIILRTDDGGDSWHMLNSVTEADIWDVDFMDTDTGWAVGDNGKILRTGDGGLTWSSASAEITDRTIFDLKVLSGRKLLTVGGGSKVLFSLDGGRTWDSISVDDGSADLFGLDISGDAAVAVGDSGRIIVGSDYNDIFSRLVADSVSIDTITWLNVIDTIVIDTLDPPEPETTFVEDPNDSIPDSIYITLDTLMHTVDTVWAEWNAVTSGVTTAINSVAMVSNTTGLAVGDDGVVLATADGGATWTDASIVDVTEDLLKVRFDNTSTGWIVGEGGKILYTTDGGNNWTSQTSEVTHDLYDITSRTTSNLIAAGSLTLIKTSDGGTTWQANPSGTISTPSLMDITFVNDSLGFAVGFGGAILRTTDGGETWEYRRRNKESFVDEWFTEVQFWDESTGWSIGFTPTQGAIWNTANGGESWIKQSTDDEEWTSRAEGMFFLNQDIGWIVAVDKVLKTTDGGATWTDLSLILTTDLSGIAFVDELTGWVVGTAGTILKTEDGGTEWTNLTNEELISNLHDVTFVNDTTGWVVGNLGTIWRTIDGGSNWVVDSTANTTVGLNTVFFADSANGWIVGYGGTILHTVNAGLTWTKQPSPTPANLNNICTSDSTLNKLWIVGEDGLIMSTTTGGN
ncbi:MAG: hypothetical protein KOO62_12060 [candidate division Zixibacteria bacterium]|nr:hypothetical protein [candidate division Zixibacteria bacterium]